MKKTLSLILALIMCLSLCACSGETTKTETTSAATTATTVATTSKTISTEEKFAAEFCLACMDYLKNPYSFELKKAWINRTASGAYEISVTFTVENQFGGTSTLSLSDSLIFDDFDDYIADFDWLDFDLLKESAIDSSSEGEYLDTEIIQNYIDKNYK